MASSALILEQRMNDTYQRLKHQLGSDAAAGIVLHAFVCVMLNDFVPIEDSLVYIEKLEESGGSLELGGYTLTVDEAADALRVRS